MQARANGGLGTREPLTRGPEQSLLEAHFSRDKTLETADFIGIPKESIIGQVNYRPRKELGSPGLIFEPPKHRTNVARIKVAIPVQLRAVEKILSRKAWDSPIMPTWARNFQKIRVTGNPMGPHSWPRLWQFMIARTLDQRG